MRIMCFLSMIFMLGLMPIIPLVSQVRAAASIIPHNFKKIKIKRFSFLFKGIGGKDSIYGSVKDYGIILPMFILQILGYILCILSIIIVVLCIAFHVLLYKIVMIILSILIFESITCCLIIIFCEIKGKRNKQS